MEKTVYVSGPIAGKPDGNKKLFESARRYLLTRPGVVKVHIPHDITPWHHLGDCPPSYATNEGHSAACHLRADLQVMLGCDEVYLLPGWEASVGARLELQVAAACGLPVHFLKPEITRLWHKIQPALDEAFEAMRGLASPWKDPNRWAGESAAEYCERQGHLTVGKTGKCEEPLCPNHIDNGKKLEVHNTFTGTSTAPMIQVGVLHGRQVGKRVACEHDPCVTDPTCPHYLGGSTIQ